MSIEYAPTGREFVTGSYDRTVSLSLALLIINLGACSLIFCLYYQGATCGEQIV